MPEKKKYSLIEEEVIILKASYDLIGSMVNNNIMTFWQHSNDYTEVRAQTEEKFLLYSIFLVDFLSKPDINFLKSNCGYLSELKKICLKKEKTLNCRYYQELNDNISSLIDWLQEEVTIENIWLPSIEKKINLKISRYEAIKIYGDYTKHNFSRFGRNISTIKELLKKSGHEISTDQVVLIFDELIDNWISLIPKYHTPTIAEHLNNIRWTIFFYLKPVYQRCYKSLGQLQDTTNYKYEIPLGIESELSKGLFWGLMNDVRSEPYIPRFEVNPILKERF